MGLADPGLLSDAAAEQPLPAVVNDAQWLDRASAQTPASVVHRVDSERIAMVVVLRESDSVSGLGGAVLRR